ncbi:MAG: HAMP domain-containing sensor histidine kinase [Actinomycetota bacterium]|nr:HAMP domain-containing sensor histidine kinase [Actinomycetota bacterium]
MTTPLTRRPLRVKISLLMVVLLSAGLLVSSFIATTALSGYLMDRVDEAMTAGTRPLTSVPLPVGPMASPDGEQFLPPSRFYMAVVFADGSPTRVISHQDDNVAAVPLLPGVADLEASAGAPMTVGSAASSGDWRILATYVPELGGWVVVGTSLADLEATVRRLVLLQFVVGVVVVAVAAGVGYLVVRRSLRPLDEISTVARAIADGDLSQRVPALGGSTEVDQLATAFNSMVTRIEESFDAQRASELQARDSEERMRQFVADASHELRTPLTSIRGYAELIEQGAADDPAEAVRRIQAESARMGSLVDDMLMLARLDEERTMDVAPIDLLEVVIDAAASARAAAPGRSIEVLSTDGSTAMVSGDGERLRQAVDNLLSNAIRYSPDSEPVTITVRVDDDWCHVLVTDRGAGLGPAEAGRVFERMYRTDEARSRVRGGSGLGLAIVKSVVEGYGGQVWVDSTPGAGCTFTIRLPLLRQ